MITNLVGRTVGGAVRGVSPSPLDLRIFMAERNVNDDLPCKCCAQECESEMTVSVSFCGMTVTETLAIPGILNQGQANLPDGSYLILSASISCGPCGWFVDIGVCAYCDATQEAASDAFTGTVPFDDTPSPPNSNTYCPELGAVNLTCFGDQFGLPCLTNPTANIA